MGYGDRDSGGGGGGGGFGFRGRRSRKCKCVKHVDYKDTGALRKYTSAQGTIYSRKRAQTCAKCQKRVKHAIKVARFMGIISYSN